MKYQLNFTYVLLSTLFLSHVAVAMNSLSEATPLLDLREGFELKIKSEKVLGEQRLESGQTHYEFYLVGGKVLSVAEYGEELDQRRTTFTGSTCILQTQPRSDLSKSSYLPKSVTPRVLRVAQVLRSPDGVTLEFEGDMAFKHLKCLGTSPTLSDVSNAFGVAMSAHRLSKDVNHLNSTMVFTGKNKRAPARESSSDAAGTTN